MTVERTICRYVVVIGTGEFCGHASRENAPPCSRENCTMYTPLMYKPEEMK